MRVLATAIALVTTACAPIISTSVPPNVARSTLIVSEGETADCVRSSAVARARALEEEIEAAPTVERPTPLDAIPPEIRRITRAAGLDPTLAALIEQRAGGGDVDVTALRLQVVMRISSLEIQLSSLTFEVGCMGRQMDAKLLELDRLEQRQQLVLTIASLVVGAATGVGAGVWELAEPDSMPGPLVLGVVGGTASFGLGVAGLVPRRGRVIYRHERNPFTPILTGTDPDGIYPPFVFRMLLAARLDGGQSSRDELLHDWRRIVEESVPERDRKQAEAVLYGEGGTYDRNLVEAREKMLDRLESELDGIERDLEVLYTFLDRVLAERGHVAPPSDP